MESVTFGPNSKNGCFSALYSIGLLFFSSNHHSISRARVKTWEHIFNYCCRHSTMLWSTPIRLSFNLLESSREVPGLSRFLHLSISKLVKRHWATESEKDEWDSGIKGMDCQKGIDNFAPAVGLYKHDSCIQFANFFTINLPIGCIEDIRA